MYKVAEDTINKFKSAIKLTSEMMEAAHAGKKLHPDEVKKVLANNMKLIKLIENNYNG